MNRFRIFVAMLLFASIVNTSRSDDDRSVANSLFGLAPHQLLRKASVQRDLALDADQVSKIAHLDRLAKSKLPPRKTLEPGKKNRADLKRIKQLTEGMSNEAREILTPAQWQRLEQIGFQLQIRNQGLIAAFGNPGVQKQLQLSETQIAEVESWMQQQAATIAEIRSNRNTDAVRPKMDEFHSRSNRALTSLLTAIQRTALEAMTGAEFTFDPNEFGVRR